MAQVVEQLPGKHRVLTSIPSTSKNQKRKGGGGGGNRDMACSQIFYLNGSTDYVIEKHVQYQMFYQLRKLH
jgi:hypothetical protein